MLKLIFSLLVCNCIESEFFGKFSFGHLICILETSVGKIYKLLSFFIIIIITAYMYKSFVAESAISTYFYPPPPTPMLLATPLFIP